MGAERAKGIAVAAAILAAHTAIVSAEPSRSTLRGRVSDSYKGRPVEGALVYVAGVKGFLATTDKSGRYVVELAPGAYEVIFAYGESRTTARVTLRAGQQEVLDGHVDSSSGEVIVIREPPVPPKPRNWSSRRAPPYSDQAVSSDAWTRAWLLLDVNTRGEVTRLKFLKRPGYDLERIALREAFKLRFDPARNRAGSPIRVWLVWGIEWPSAGWLERFEGTRSGMPSIVGFPPRRRDWYVPCRGSGPLKLGSEYPVYKDCSVPDVSRAREAPWIDARPRGDDGATGRNPPVAPGGSHGG